MVNLPGGGGGGVEVLEYPSNWNPDYFLPPPPYPLKGSSAHYGGVDKSGVDKSGVSGSNEECRYILHS